MKRRTARKMEPLVHLIREIPPNDMWSEIQARQTQPRPAQGSRRDRNTMRFAVAAGVLVLCVAVGLYVGPHFLGKNPVSPASPVPRPTIGSPLSTSGLGPTTAPSTFGGVESFPLSSGPSDVLVAFGSVWVSEPRAQSVERLDPKTGSSLATIPVGAAPTSLAQSGDSVWVLGTEAVDRISAKTNGVVTSIPFSGGADLAATEGALWVTEPDSNSVASIDPAAGSVIANVTVPGQPWGVVAVDGAVWVASLGGGGSRIDPSNSSVVQSIPMGPASIVGGDGYVWFGTSGGVLQIDARTGAVVRTVALGKGGGPAPIQVQGNFGDGYLWAALEGVFPSPMWRIDPSDGATQTIDLPPVNITGIGIGSGSIFLLVGSDSPRLLHVVEPAAG